MNNTINQEELEEHTFNVKNLLKLIQIESNLIHNIKNKEIEYKNREEILKNLKDSYINSQNEFYKNNDNDNSYISVNLTDFQINLIYNLEKKLDFLKTRADELENDIEECKDKNNQEKINTENLLFKDKIFDYIKENIIIEKYIQSENFKTSNELIISKKFNLENLQNEKEKFENIYKDLVNNYNKLQKLESKMKKKIIKFNK